MKDMVLDDPTSSSETADRISRLPEDVILRILFFLSVKDAARTSVLSKTWQHIWALLPVFSFCSDALLRQGNLLYASFDANKYMDLVDKSLEELRHCKVRIKRFQIHLFEIQRHASRFNQFMELANRNQVEELVVHGLVSTLDLKKPSLPLATFASTNTFKVLDLKACVLTPELLKDEPRFPCLTKLSLFKVNYSRMDQMVENLLANCHLLKEFFLEDCEVERVKLDHPKLERVRILGVGVIWIKAKNIRILFLTYKGDKPLELSLVCCDNLDSLFLWSTFTAEYIQELVAKLPHLRSLN